MARIVGKSPNAGWHLMGIEACIRYVQRIVVLPCKRLRREAARARFESLSRLAGMEAEAEGLNETARDAEIEAIKREVFQERYGP